VNRRKFLKFLGLAPAIAVVPSVLVSKPSTTLLEVTRTQTDLMRQQLKSVLPAEIKVPYGLYGKISQRKVLGLARGAAFGGSMPTNEEFFDRIRKA
jgi:hypothetical protein